MLVFIAIGERMLKNHFLQGISCIPSLLLTNRAVTNRRSDSLLRYTIIAGFIDWFFERDTTALSARRATPLLRCKNDASTLPPGRIKNVIDSSSDSILSIIVSNTDAIFSLVRGILPSAGGQEGSARSEPRTKRSFCTCSKVSAISESKSFFECRNETARPILEFSSSHPPYPVIRRYS